MVVLGTWAFVMSQTAMGMSFTLEDVYGTNYFSNTIVRYDSAGNVAETLAVPGGLADDIRGIAFGPDEFLYAVAARGSGFAVLALDESGAVQATYPYSSNYIRGNLSYGKIAFDRNNRFYVGGSSGVIQFDIGNESSGSRIFSTGTYDVESLPSGNLLALTGHRLYEIDTTGQIIRQIRSFTDSRGVEYDPAEDAIYVTMLGHTGSYFQLMKLNGEDGALIDSTTFHYGDDMFLTTDDQLIVGSRTQSPGVFSKDLAHLGSFSGDDRMFVTQFVEIPKPATLSLLALGGLAMIRRRRKARIHG
jgi:DNA-binding beta-propeller fold protein YncE